jgi:nitrite reductase (NADH) large subunit
LDIIWSDSLYKQVSGFVLVGLIALALTLSLRKRIAKFRFGAYTSWRFVHTALGLSALAMAFGHTGFRLGYNLNQALMLAFLLSALTGGVSGALLVRAAAAPQGSVLAHSLRIVRTLHDWVFWPLCVLIGFHVLKVYYF